MVTVVLGVASSVLMALLFHPGSDPSRIYYGTDTRLFDLMAGATVAFVAASRRQPNPQARRTLHVVGPAAGRRARRVLGDGGHRPAACRRTSCSRAASSLCAALAGLVVADARLTDPGPFARALAWRPLHFIGHHLLRHLPVALAGDRLPQRGPHGPVRLAARPAPRRRHARAGDRQLLPGRAARPRWPGCTAGVRVWGAPLAGVATAVVIVVATIPAVADPSTRGRDHAPAPASAGRVVPGTGGYQGQLPIHLTHAALAGSPAARAGPRATRSCTTPPSASRRHCRRRARPSWPPRTIDGFGLVTATNWPTAIPDLIRQTGAQLIVASWSWDQDGPTTPNALHQPAQYTRAAAPRRRHDAGAGQRRGRRDLHRVPPVGVPRRAANPADHGGVQRERRQGVVGLERHRRHDDRRPSRAGSCTSRWPVPCSSTGSTRPGSRPRATRTRRTGEWIRVRKLDNVHLCPEGSARYADALLSDMTPSSS